MPRVAKRRVSKASKSEGGGFDVKELRVKLGRAVGKPSVSRSVLAEILGVSAGSVLNWETGKPINAANVARLKDLAAKAETGGVFMPERRRGGRPPKVAAGNKRQSRQVTISSDVAPLYANAIVVERGKRDARIRFGLSYPSAGGARLVADVFVPLDALEGLR